jgi:hypothetical protein
VTREELLLQKSFEELIDMYVAVGKDYGDYIMKKAPKKSNPWGNFKSPEVNIVKSPKKVEWRRV